MIGLSGVWDLISANWHESKTWVVFLNLIHLSSTRYYLFTRLHLLLWKIILMECYKIYKQNEPNPNSKQGPLLLVCDIAVFKLTLYILVDILECPLNDARPFHSLSMIYRNKSSLSVWVRQYILHTLWMSDWFSKMNLSNSISDSFFDMLSDWTQKPW